MTRRLALLAGLAATLAWPAGAVALTVSLQGTLGERVAVLVIDGQPRTVAVGASVAGVRLLALQGGEADVEVEGKRRRLRLGESQAAIGGTASDESTQAIVLTAGPGGHFVTEGKINGKSVQFLVDTGATSITLGQADAERIGLDYRRGQRFMTRTANGNVPGNLVTLSSVRIGDVEVAQVQAAVLPTVMPHVLLGNSFLSRFQMKRENDVLRLEKRP